MMASLRPPVIGCYDHPMTDLSDRGYEALFAHLTEKGATCCRRKFPALRDDHIKALHLVIDELADTWKPELTAREWMVAAGQRLGVNFSKCV
jgi:hypothetical protein